MPTRKIADIEQPKRCLHPEHDPPMFQVFDPGLYRHECPSCGRQVIFVISVKGSLLHEVPRADDDDDIDSNPMHNIGYGRGDDTAERLARQRKRQH